jgi:hypothetical protein
MSSPRSSSNVSPTIKRFLSNVSPTKGGGRCATKTERNATTISVDAGTRSRNCRVFLTQIAQMTTDKSSSSNVSPTIGGGRCATKTERNATTPTWSKGDDATNKLATLWRQTKEVTQ